MSKDKCENCIEGSEYGIKTLGIGLCRTCLEELYAEIQDIFEKEEEDE